jgi:hypothetical protein
MANQDAHRTFAREAHEKTWQLLETSPRSAEQDAQMIEAAHTSSYHWAVAGTGLHRQRAHWLLSRVYSVLGMGERALYHAVRCAALTEEFEELMLDYDRAFALEGLARANAAAGNLDQAASFIRQAEQAGQAIADSEDRNYFLLDLRSGNWYDLVVD